MSSLPVGRAGYDALCRSTTPCEGSVGRWTPVIGGRKDLPSAPGVLDPPVPVYANFSAFLDDMEDGVGDDPDPADEAVGSPGVPVTRGKVASARVAHVARLGTLVWEDLKDKVPACLQEGSPGMKNSAEAAVWEVLSDIGTGSPGWDRCSAAKARVTFVRASGVSSWDEARRSAEAESALRVFQKSLRAKAECLR